ncbi:MAG: hypothetical protein CSB47_02685 [Proteobacteria bacterium]|nr:MAG: hypothetical protein CSB47_02685 [Pseudomonadota bacterium]
MNRFLLRKQQGVVLIWALGILLILMLLSVSSLKLAKSNTQIAGNSMASMLVFQGVESTLSKTANTNYIQQAAIATGRNKAVPSADLPTEAVSGGRLSSKARVSYLGYSPCPAVHGVALSTNASPSAGGITCQVYQIDAESRLRGTGAKANHRLGVAKIVPPTNATLNN